MLGKFFDGLAEAISDIRQKLVEEGWFGRAVTQERPEAVPPAETGWEMKRAGFDEQWAVRAPDKAQEHAVDAPEPPGMDL